MLPRRALPLSLALSLSLLPSLSHAGGGPMNVMVLYSADDTNAAQVAHHYASVRSLPQAHLCGLSGLSPSTTSIDVPTYQSLIQAPFDACLAALPHPEEIDYLVLVRGLPYSVTLPTYFASLEAMLQVHHAQNTMGMELAGQGQPGTDQPKIQNPSFPPGFGVPADYTIQNPYGSWYSASSTILRAAMQPASFRRSAAGSKNGYSFKDNLFIVSSLDGFDYQDALDLVDRGAASDGTFPTAELLCMRGEDEARAARDPECELVTRMLGLAGFNAPFVDPFDASLSGHTVAAYFTGSADSARTAIAGNTFVPGAIACNLTSYGAAIQNFFCTQDGTACPESEAQTSIARFIRAGATGAHGTVNEPLNNPFPNAGTYLFYTFGYNMGESFFFNQRFLYWQNIHLGDPLASPWAERPKVALNQGSSTLPQGAPLTLSATHPAGVARVELYASGARIASADGDSLSASIPGASGDTLDLLAIAFANNAPVTRIGWPEPNQQPRPDVQGWTNVQITLTDPLPGAGGAGGAGGMGGGGAGGGGSGQGGTEGGCGCRAAGDSNAPSPAILAACLFAAAILRRRGRVGAC